jgi:hypothetical protein
MRVPVSKTNQIIAHQNQHMRKNNNSSPDSSCILKIKCSRFSDLRKLFYSQWNGD